MKSANQSNSLEKSPIKNTLLDLPDDILRHITAFYERKEILGFIRSCKKIYTMPFMGYVDRENKYIQVVVVLDTTGSMASCIENLKPSILMILVKAKEEYPDYVVLFSIVEYGDVDTCFNIDKEYIQGKAVVAQLTYKPGSHFISIQSPLKVFDKIYKMLFDLQLRGGGGPEALDQAIIHLEKEFGSSWVGCRQPYSPSVDYVIFLGDVVGHNMGNDGKELYLDFFGQHGLSKDWFAPLKKLYKKNVVFIHMGLTENWCSSPAVHRHFGCIIAALGGYSFNIDINNVFDIPRIIIDLMKPELATRNIIQKTHMEVVYNNYGVSSQEIRKSILKKLDESKTFIQETHFDLSMMNKGSKSFEQSILTCDTLKDLENIGFMPTRETLIFLARLQYGYFNNMGEINKKATNMLKKRNLEFPVSSYFNPQNPIATTSIDLLNIPMKPTTLIRQLTCATPITNPLLHINCPIFSQTLSDPSNSNKKLKTQCISPKHASSFNENRNFGIIRMKTNNTTNLSFDSNNDIQTTKKISLNELPIFKNSPWREIMNTENNIKLFKSGSKAPVPSRLQIGIIKPRTMFKTYIEKLELDIRTDDLNIAREKLINAQKFQKPIIDFGSFEKYCENLTPYYTKPKVQSNNSSIALQPIITINTSDLVNEPITTLILERSRSVFIPNALVLHRESTSVNSSNSQTLRNLNSQFK
jgi:hypothetical protein